MSKLKSLVLVLLVLLLVGLGAPGAPGQDAGGGPPPNSGGGGGTGAGAGAGVGVRTLMPRSHHARDRFRQMISDHLKAALGASDDEWAVIGPRAQKVLTLQFQTFMDSGMGRLMGRNRPGGGDASDRPPSAVSTAADALRAALEDKTSSNNDIKVKVDALRAAHEQARKDIAAAQKDLRDVLTVRQEAILVSYSILD